MANPASPQDAGGRYIPWWADSDNPGTAYLPLGIGSVSLGSGRTPGTHPAVALFGVASAGVLVRHNIADTFKPFDLTGVTTEQIIWTPGSGLKFRILGIHLKATVETKLALLDGTGGTVIFRIGAGDSVAETLELGPIGILSGAADRKVYITSSASADITGTIWGIEQA